MLSDEEKNVIDLLKNIDKQKCLMLNCPVVKNNIERQLKIIELNRIIRKQSKEIEELKEINNETVTQIYIRCSKKFRDKIKAKIEEIKEEKEHYLEINDEYNGQICDCIIEEYESFLEKE